MSGHITTPRFCQTCGGELIRVLNSSQDGPPLICRECGQTTYLDPKVAAAVVLFHNGGVVLLKRAQRDQAHGRWILPGGHVDRGEVVREAARREAREETGLEVELDQLVGVYSYPDNPVVLIVYLGHSRSESISASDEALDIECFHPGRIPWADLGYRSTKDALLDAFDLLNIDDSGKAANLQNH